MSDSMTDDPCALLAAFRASAQYAAAFARFFAGKRLASDVTPEEQREVFEDSAAARTVLFDVAQHELALRYVPAHYAPPTRAALDAYIACMHATREALRHGPSPDEIVQLDLRRSAQHTAAAHALVAEGLAPNETLARALARLILVDLGLATWANARETEVAHLEFTVQRVDLG